MSAALAAAAVLAGACGGTSAGPDPSAADPAEPLASLCRAQTADDPGEVRDAFARAHGPLHDLARETQERDRAASATLLEAKQRVESALGEPEQEGFDALLGDLIAATRGALRASGSPAPPCPSAN